MLHQSRQPVIIWFKIGKKVKIIIWINKSSILQNVFIIIEEEISVKVCWETSNVQDAKNESIKSAYCTLLDVPHKSKIPESGNILNML